MTFTDITSSGPWEAFQASVPWSQFTQSWSWGEFRRSLGFDVRRFALVSPEGTWLAAVQCEYRPKKIVGGYWFAPRGPVFSPGVDHESKRQILEACLQGLATKKLSRALFWRIEPFAELGKPEGLMPLRLRRAMPANPSSTILLDLDRTQDALLEGMHHKTRYNIKLANRHGVTTRIATHPDDRKAFLDLLAETATRDRFVQHDASYLLALITHGEREGISRIRLAEHGGKILAGNLEILYGDTVTYLHGASAGDARHVMAPYALHWDAIMQAQRDGFRLYDFWGVNPRSKAAFVYKPSWEGISRFKAGWGGRHVDLYGTWDLPFSTPLYALAFPRVVWCG